MLKDLKDSTRQRMVAIEFGFPPADVEEKIVAHEAGIDADRAAELVRFGQAIRRLETAGLREVASTRVLIAAGRLVAEGLSPREAARAADRRTAHRRPDRGERPRGDDRRVPGRPTGLTPSNGDDMSYESKAEPIKLGYLMDFRLPEMYPQEMRDDLTQPFDLVFNEGLKQRIIDRPVEIVYREAEGLPKGTVKAVIDAYGELVDEGCLVIFGPSISDNCVPTREAIEQRFRVPAVSVTGTDDWLGEWTFSFPKGSLTDEPIFWADLLAKGGHTEVGVLIEQSLVGESYLEELPQRLPGRGHSHRGGGADRPDGAGRRRCGPQGARSEAERARSLRLRLRDPARQHGARRRSAGIRRASRAPRSRTRGSTP